MNNIPPEGQPPDEEFPLVLVRLLDGCGAEVEILTDTPARAAEEAADYLESMAEEGMSGSIEFGPAQS